MAFADPAAARAAYNTNLDYDSATTGSTAKAQAFIEACRYLLQQTPQQSSTGSTGVSGSIAFDLSQVRAQLDQAREWLAAQPAAGASGGVGARYYDVGDWSR